MALLVVCAVKLLAVSSIVSIPSEVTERRLCVPLYRLFALYLCPNDYIIETWRSYIMEIRSMRWSVYKAFVAAFNFRIEYRFCITPFLPIYVDLSLSLSLVYAHVHTLSLYLILTFPFLCVLPLLHSFHAYLIHRPIWPFRESWRRYKKLQPPPPFDKKKKNINNNSHSLFLMYRKIVIQTIHRFCNQMIWNPIWIWIVIMKLP